MYMFGLTRDWIKKMYPLYAECIRNSLVRISHVRLLSFKNGILKTCIIAGSGPRPRDVCADSGNCVTSRRRVDGAERRAAAAAATDTATMGGQARRLPGHKVPAQR